MLTPLRIGIVSDVHCDAPTLLRALDEMSDVDEVLCAGDLVFDFRFSNEVLEIICDRGIRHVMGNHDAGVLAPTGERVRAKARQEHIDYLHTVPEVLQIEIAGKRIYMVHGSPWDPLREYMYPYSPKVALLGEFETDYMILGHTHVSMVKQAGSVTVINPGSIGDPRDRTNGRLPTYAVLDLASGACEIRTIGRAASRGGRTDA